MKEGSQGLILTEADLNALVDVHDLEGLGTLELMIHRMPLYQISQDLTFMVREQINLLLTLF